MATYRPAVSTATRRILKGLRQQEAVTGSRLEPDQIEAITRGELGAERDRALGFATLEQSDRQFGERMDLVRKQIDDADRAAAVSGVTDIAGLGASYYLTKGQIAAEAANTEALREVAFKMGGGYENLASSASLVREGLVMPAVSSTAPMAVGETAMTGAFDSLGASTGMAGDAGTMANVVAETGGTVAGTTAAGTTLASVAGPAAFGAVGAMIGKQVNEEVGGMVGGALAGAMAGTLLFPGIGTAAGFAIGGITGFIQDATVICGELYEQGYLPVNVLIGDKMYATYHVDREVYEGYRVWANPLVKLMRRSKLVTAVIAPLGICWARTMANKVDKDVKVNRLQKLVGNTMLMVGTPVCRLLAQRRLAHG